MAQRPKAATRQTNAKTAARLAKLRPLMNRVSKTNSAVPLSALPTPAHPIVQVRPQRLAAIKQHFKLGR